MDSDNDLYYYYLLKAWIQNDNTRFNLLDSHDTNIIVRQKLSTYKSRITRKISSNQRICLTRNGDRSNPMTHFRHELAYKFIA